MYHRLSPMSEFDEKAATWDDDPSRVKSRRYCSKIKINN